MTDVEFLEAMKAYIELLEETCEFEWGNCRSAKKLIEDGDMPEVYAEVLRRLEIAKGSST